MTSCIHTMFEIERHLPGPPGTAFRFFSDPALKRRWTACHPDWRELEAAMDFRNGGEELSRLLDAEGCAHEFRARYLDIADGCHIFYAFTMRIDEALVSSSHVTIELTPSSGGTAMLYTEQAAFLRREDLEMRRDGTGAGFDRLVVEIERSLATLQ